MTDFKPVTFESPKQFASYISNEELPRTGDARRFRMTLPFQTGDRIEQMSWEWSYSGTQEAVDEKAGVDGLMIRRARAVDQFRAHVERDLAQRGERLYSVGEGCILCMGKPNRS